ncbi:MFS transporter [Microbacterium oxydans]|uniref:MFS transporter n=1 Tax=Microbacterium sp. B19(2022) TaxID=2914045 RepID=UPI001431F8C1|nr:MFS transporter [Microbacterium sp. B19(2022)]NJI58292.1 MFS transporter [Microbacterium sp. B19(2022)]
MREPVSPEASSIERAALFGTAVDAVGTGAFVSAAALFFTLQNGVSPIAVGVGLTASAVAGALASVPVAHFADRFGPFRVFAISYSLRAAGVIGWLAVSGDLAFLVYSVVFGLVDRSAASLTRSIVAAPLSKDDAVRVFGRMALPGNIGYGVGAGFSALVLFLELPLSLVVGANSLSFILVVLVYRPAFQGKNLVGARVRPSLLASRSSMISAFASRRRVRVTWENFVFSFHRTLLNVYLPLLVVSRWPTLSWIVPLAFIANATCVALVQARTNAWVVRGYNHAIAWATSGIILGLSILVLATAAPRSNGGIGIVLLSALILLQIVAEILHSAALAVYMVKLSRGSALTTDMSAMNVGGQLQNIVGPVIFGALVGPTTWMLGVVVGAGVLVTGLRASSSSRRRWFESEEDAVEQ